MASGNKPKAIAASSGNVAAATAAATLAAVTGALNYLSGFSVSGAGATGALVVSVTVTGLEAGTLTFTYTAVAGVTLANTPLFVEFNPPLPASGEGVAIVVSCPTLGAGNTNNTTNAWGERR
jgi:hypothetical protein